MVLWLLGCMAGIGIGIVIGIVLGKKQKSWSELNEKEKKERILLIILGSVLCLAGIITFFVINNKFISHFYLISLSKDFI